MNDEESHERTIIKRTSATPIMDPSAVANPTWPNQRWVRKNGIVCKIPPSFIYSECMYDRCTHMVYMMKSENKYLSYMPNIIFTKKGRYNFLYYQTAKDKQNDRAINYKLCQASLGAQYS